MTPTMPARAPHRPAPPGAEAPSCLRVALAGGRILACNEAFARLVGRPVEALVGTEVAALLAPSERGPVLARLDALVHFGRDRIAAVALEASGGSRALCALDALFVPDADEAVDLVVRPLPRAGTRRAPRSPAPAPSSPASTASPPPLPEPSAPADARSAGPRPGTDGADGGTAGEALRLLDHLGHAAIALDEGGRAVAANAAAAALLGQDVAVAGRPLGALFVLSEPARAALDAAVRLGEPHAVQAGTPGGARVVALRWIPVAGGGYAVAEERAPVDPTTSRILLAGFQTELISHDATNQLAALGAALGRVRRALGGEAPAAWRALEAAFAALERVEDTIALTQDLSLDAGRAREVVDLARCVRGAVSGRLDDAAEAGVTIETELEEGLTVRAPASWPTRIATNLVDNALGHLPTGGTIRVAVRREDRERPGAHLEVTDTGVGVPREDRDRIFEKGVTGRAGGRGLGLYIVRHLAVGLGGQVHCDERPGGGAAFHVWLPLAPDGAIPNEPEEANDG